MKTRRFKGRKRLTPQENIKRMGEMPMFKLLLIQSIPNIFSLLSLSLYQIIISIYIGNFLDEAALAAQSIYSPIEYLICTSLPTAFSSGAVTLIGPALGQGRKEQANIYLMQFLYWSLFFCIICPAILLPGLKYIVKGLGATTDEEFNQAYLYSFLITLLGPLFYTPNGGFLPLFRCENRSGTAMIVQITSSVLCVVFGSILFPTIGRKLGLASAALSTLLSLFPTSIYTLLNFMGCFNLGCCIKICKCKQRSVLQFIPRVKPQFKVIGTIVAQAMPQFLNAIPYHVGVWLCNLQIGHYVSDASRREKLSAAMGMTNKLGFVVLQPRMAIYMAFASILAYNFGAKKYDRVLKLCKYCFWYIIGVITGLSLLMIALCNPLSKMFSRDAEFVALGQKALILSMIGYPLGGPLMLCSGIYQIFKRPWLASIFQLIRLILTIAFMYAVPPMFGIDYIFVAFSLADTLTGFVGLGFFIYLYKKIKKMQDEYLKQQEIEKDVVTEDTTITATQEVLHGDTKSEKQ